MNLDLEMGENAEAVPSDLEPGGLWFSLGPLGSVPNLVHTCPLHVHHISSCYKMGYLYLFIWLYY